jgi:hypothetical protein
MRLPAYDYGFMPGMPFMPGISCFIGGAGVVFFVVGSFVGVLVIVFAAVFFAAALLTDAFVAVFAVTAFFVLAIAE